MMHLYWVALKSIWAKEIHRFMRIWVQTLVPPVITMTLYFIIFGNLIGSRIGDMHGFSYMQFIVPGLIMMSVITNAYANVASSFFGAKFSIPSIIRWQHHRNHDSHPRFIPHSEFSLPTRPAVSR